MKKIYTLLFVLLFTGAGLQATAQECKKTCEIEKEVGDGVFLGVQIHSHKGKSGVHVVQVLEGTQAEKMGLQKGDMIYAVNGVEMTDTPFMIEWVSAQYAGMPVEVALERKKEKMTLAGELGYKTVQTVTETICCDKNVGKLMVQGYKAYPNPSRGDFSLAFEVENDQEIELRIVDMSGNLIFENTIFPKGGVVNELISVDGSLSGDHIMVLSQGGNTIEKKMIFVK